MRVRFQFSQVLYLFGVIFCLVMSLQTHATVYDEVLANLKKRSFSDMREFAAEIQRQLAPGARPIELSVPRGRSLGRHHSDFKLPRDIYAILGKRGFEEPLIFLGYIRATNELEIISWDKKEGKYFFSLQKGFSPSNILTPDMQPTGFCESCHQGGIPILSRFPWSESTNRPEIFNEIMLALNPKIRRSVDPTERVVSLSSDPNVEYASKYGADAFSFDRAVRFSARKVQAERICRTACEEGNLACKRYILAFAAIPHSRADDIDAESIRDLDLKFAEAARSSWPEDQFAFPSSVLVDRKLFDSQNRQLIAQGVSEYFVPVQSLDREDFRAATPNVMDSQQFRVLKGSIADLRLQRELKLINSGAIDVMSSLLTSSMNFEGNAKLRAEGEPGDRRMDPLQKRQLIGHVPLEEAGRLLLGQLNQCLDGEVVAASNFDPVLVLGAIATTDRFDDLLQGQWPPDVEELNNRLQTQLTEMGARQIQRNPNSEESAPASFAVPTEEEIKKAQDIVENTCASCHNKPPAPIIPFDLNELALYQSKTEKIPSVALQLVRDKIMPPQDTGMFSDSEYNLLLKVLGFLARQQRPMPESPRLEWVVDLDSRANAFEIKLPPGAVIKSIRVDAVNNPFALSRVLVSEGAIPITINELKGNYDSLLQREGRRQDISNPDISQYRRISLNRVLPFVFFSYRGADFPLLTGTQLKVTIDFLTLADNANFDLAEAITLPQFYVLRDTLSTIQSQIGTLRDELENPNSIANRRKIFSSNLFKLNPDRSKDDGSSKAKLQALKLRHEDVCKEVREITQKTWAEEGKTELQRLCQSTEGNLGKLIEEFL